MHPTAISRRSFALLAGAAAAAWPTATRAQSTARPVIGVLSSRGENDSRTVLGAFRKGLAEGGLVEGQNVDFAYRWANGRYDQLPPLAADLVKARVSVILAAGGAPAALAAKAASTSIPVVFSGVEDPVGAGVVASINRPGANVTGMSLLNTTLVGKRLEILHQLVPDIPVIASLVNPTFTSGLTYAADSAKVANALGVELRNLNVTTTEELNAALASLPAMKPVALLVAGEPFLDTQAGKIPQFTLENRIPACFAWRELASLGGLVSYGTSLPENYRKAGLYVARIVKGDKPADLPVQLPAKFETVINMKTAGALGLEVPSMLLGSADDLIE